MRLGGMLKTRLCLASRFQNIDLNQGGWQALKLETDTGKVRGIAS